MKPLATATAILFTSFALVSCGKKESDAGADKDPGATGSPETSEPAATSKSHSDIADAVVGEMTTMMNGMAGIKDVATAEAFAATVPSIKTTMKQCLADAKSLPAPTEAEKASFKSKMDAAQEAAGPQMMAMMMSMSQNPNADAIGKVLEGAMDDEEMDGVMEELEGIYAIEEAEEAPAPVTE